MAMLNLCRPSHRTRRKNARRIREDQELTLPGTDIFFHFQRDGCRTLRLAVKADGTVQVKAPELLPLENVFTFMYRRLAWIREKRDFFAAHRGTPSAVLDGTTILYLARPFIVRPVTAGKKRRARLTGRVLELPCLRSEADAEAENRATAAAFRRWQTETARLVLGRRLDRMARHARHIFGDDASVTSLTVRVLRRRWGSCSIRGDITLAVQLVEMPLPLIDYVICHELCHLRAMNHGPYFHRLLHTLVPDAKEKERRIHIWGLEHPRKG